MAITAQAIVDRMKSNMGPDAKASTVDAFLAGDPNAEVTGVVTTFAPSLEILRKAVASGKNMIVARESPYWARPPGLGSAPPSAEALAADPTYRMKRDFIAANKLIVFRLFENWTARAPSGQLQGLAKALGWAPYYKPAVGRRPWARDNGFFEIPPSTLKATAQNAKRALGAKAVRVGGDPNQPVRKVALLHGINGVPELQRTLAEPGIDLVVMGEPSWEFFPGSYVFDLQAEGFKVGILLLGHQASEEPGANEMAAWLKSFVPEVPVESMRAGEPLWMLS